MFQRVWWKGYHGETSAPLSVKCSLCEHITGQHDQRRFFLLFEGKIIGRKRVFFCQHCDCNPTTYLELIERPEESTFWDFVSAQEEFKEYGQITVTEAQLKRLREID